MSYQENQPVFALHLQPGELTLAQLRAVHQQPVKITLDERAFPAIDRSVACVENIIAEGRTAYGINTGFGLLAQTRIAREDLENLQRSLVLSHAAGVGEPIDDALYASLVAHELTHAVAQQHMRADKIGSPAQEYLAYAVQLATLPEARREAIVAAAGVRGWETGDTVSNIYLGLNVHRFAVKSYLHLYGHPQRAEVVQTVLASRGNVTFTAP